MGNAATSVEYSLWIQGSGPLLYGFVPTPSVWVSAAASANMTVTVRGKGKEWRRRKQNAGGAPLSTTSVRYRISRNSGTSWEAWLDVASVSGSTFRTGALGAGANRVQFIAADIVANMANLTSSVSVDSVAPVYSLFGPTVWVKSNTVANVTITDTQSGTVTATVKYMLTTDGSSFGAWEAVATYYANGVATTHGVPVGSEREMRK